MIKMDKEQTPDPHLETNPYRQALELFNERVEELKEAGEIRRVTDIASAEELDDHFDDLRQVYRQICLEMGLAWPPPFSNDTADSRLLSADGTDEPGKNVVQTSL